MMDDRESILDLIDKEESLEDMDDIEMLDVEEGELIDGKAPPDDVQQGKENEGCADEVTSEPLGKIRRRRRNKRKNKKNKSNGAGSNVTDINRYVLDICKRLKEKKSYLVYSAAGCLGVSALSDLVKEVAAIQACGGQQTADGQRLRTGGGILWNILKVREPNSYKEIMRRGREFEKQFRQPNIRQAVGKARDLSGNTAPAVSEKGKDLDGLQLMAPNQGRPEQLNSEEKRTSVHSRMRRQVSYDDLLGEELEVMADHVA